MKGKIAIIDLGTNTFHLLMAEYQDNDFREIETLKKGVKLGKGSMNSGILTTQAMERGIECLIQFRSICRDRGIEKTIALATSAIREAENGKEFVRKAEESCGIEIRIIDGKREAELIHKGVNRAVPYGEGTDLILDIGGGSTEFILCHQDDLLFEKSYPLGATRIAENLSLKDPLKEKDVEQVESHLSEHLKDLTEACTQNPPQRLIGSSGAFETLKDITHLKFKQPVENTALNCPIRKEDFEEINREIVFSPRDRRLLIPGLTPLRADLMPTGCIIADWVRRTYSIPEMLYSRYSMAEGALVEYLEEKSL